MQPPPAAEDLMERRAIYYIIWGAFVFSVLVYFLLSVLIADSPDRIPRPDPLTGRAAYLPYIVPAVLGILGVMAHHLLTVRPMRAARAVRAEPDVLWRHVRNGFGTMMVLFQANILTGLILFFTGMSFPRFLVFVVTSLLLMGIALGRLLRTWPSDIESAR